MDSLAKVGTIVGEVDSILNGEEQNHGDNRVKLGSMDVQVEHVSFGYHDDIGGSCTTYPFPSRQAV